MLVGSRGLGLGPCSWEVWWLESMLMARLPLWRQRMPRQRRVPEALERIQSVLQPIYNRHIASNTDLPVYESVAPVIRDPVIKALATKYPAVEGSTHRRSRLSLVIRSTSRQDTRRDIRQRGQESPASPVCPHQRHGTVGVVGGVSWTKPLSLSLSLPVFVVSEYTPRAWMTPSRPGSGSRALRGGGRRREGGAPMGVW